MLFADILEFALLTYSVRALFAKFAFVVAEQFCLENALFLGRRTFWEIKCRVPGAVRGELEGAKKMNASVQSLALFPLFQGFCLSWHLLYNFPLLFAMLATYQHIEA